MEMDKLIKPLMISLIFIFIGVKYFNVEVPDFPSFFSQDDGTTRYLI